MALTCLPSCLGGGCYATQENYKVTPEQSCLQPEFDVCDAQAGSLKLKNSCSESLIVHQPARGFDAGSGLSSAASPADVTIVPGATVELDCKPFADTTNSSKWFVAIPALLGSIPITITFDIIR